MSSARAAILAWLDRGALALAALLAACSAEPASPPAVEPAAPASAETAPPALVTEVEGIREYRLQNGLRVLLVPDPSQSTVTVAVTYRVGSRHEGPGEGGMAHLLEHLLFRPLPSVGDVLVALQERGADYNGTTDTDRTNYYETLPASDANLDFALRLEAERMLRSPLRAEDLAAEMTVVRNEFEASESDPDEVLRERIASAAYLFHSYGRPVIGNQSDIERVPIESLRRFYRAYYRPDNAMLVVAGAFEELRALAAIQRHFGGLARPEQALPQTYTVEPPQDGPRSVRLERVGSLASAGLAYHVPGAAHPDAPALDVLADVLADEPGGRLYRALVAKQQAAGVSAGTSSQRDPGLLSVFASGVSGGEPVELERRLIEAVEGVAGSVTADEVRRAVNRRLKQYRQLLADSRELALVLSEAEAVGDWRLLFIERDRLAQVSAEDVNRVARQYLLASNRTAGLFVPVAEPVRAQVPASPELTALVQDYRGAPDYQPGEPFEASAANIDAATQRRRAGGIELALLPKKTRGAVVHAQLAFGYGTEESLRERQAAALWLPPLMQRGTAQRSYQQWLDELDALEATLAVGGEVGSLLVALQTTRERLPQLLRLVAEMLREPALPADELEILRQQGIAELQEQLSDPQARLDEALGRALAPFPRESFFYPLTLEESIARLRGLRRDAIAELHARFLGAGHARASFVGDFDPDEVTAVLQETLGNWRSTEPYAHIAEPHLANETLLETLDTPDKRSASLALATSFPLRIEDPDYPALRFASYALGEGTDSRLFRALRAERGLSYDAGASLALGEGSDAASLSAYAIAAPQNARAARALLREQWQRWLEEPVSEAELAGYRTGFEESFRRSLGDDRSVAARLLEDLRTGRSFRVRRERVDAALALDIVQLRDAVRRHLAGRPLIDVVAGDVAAFDAADAPPPAAARESR